LNLSFNKIRTFPDLRGLTKLCILHFSANLLADIDTPSFASLVKLRELTLNANSLVQLPASIGDFTKLEKLDVSNNRIQRLPNEIGYLCSLVEIRCTGNPLVEIPRTIRDLGKLENANFDFCHLNAVCSEVTYCSRLLELGLAKNRLRELPRDMGRMTRLAMLNIADNQLTDLPITMGMCRSLGDIGAGISLDGNPIQNAALLKARAIGADHLMFYLEKRLDTVPAAKALPDIPWHGLLERREAAAKEKKNTGITVNLGVLAAPAVSSGASEGAVAARRAENADKQAKVDALKVWANEHINGVFIPKLRQIKQAIDRIETMQQAEALLMYVMRVGPALQEVADRLPDFEAEDAITVAPGVGELAKAKVQLENALNNARHILENCETVLQTTNYAETIIELVRALKGVAQHIK